MAMGMIGDSIQSRKKSPERIWGSRVGSHSTDLDTETQRHEEFPGATSKAVSSRAQSSELHPSFSN